VVYSVQALAIFATTQRRNQAQSAAESERIAIRWGVDTIAATVPFNSTQPALSVQIRFQERIDAEAAYGRLETAFDQRQPQPGSRLSLHTCTHDEDTNVCLVERLREW
jgi:hypothetical protein